MKRLFFFILIISVGFTDIKAQFPSAADLARLRLAILHREIEPLYRRPSKKELKTIEPHSELSEKYSEFLRQPNTGLTKLINDKGCADSTKVVVATESCLKYTMPGAGSSFSFRTVNYRIGRLADMTFTDNSFQASGVLLHGIFVNVGHISLEKVTLQTKGIKYLSEFQPEVNYVKAKQIDSQLTKGIRQDGYLYRRGLYIVENATFVLRSIAYGGVYYRAVSGVTYNEFDFDERKDVIIAFRIVEKDFEGNITILWKKLQEKKSPKIKRVKQNQTDVKDNNFVAGKK